MTEPKTVADAPLPQGLRYGPLAVVVFWTVIMGLLYLAMSHYLKPKSVTISTNGDLVIPKARDGHFYATGTVNGRPVVFMVDTGASLVTVSAEFAQAAGLGAGKPTVFRTANGDLSGRIVPDVPVTLGDVRVSGVRVGVGLVGGGVDEALLGQSFLAQFEVVLTKDQMTLRQK